MLINVEENLIEKEKNASIIIENEIENLLNSNEGQKIKSDIELLIQMGYDKKMINKVYILLKPPNIDRAIEYMTEVNGIYQHDFIESKNPKEKLLCFICKKPEQNHLNYIPELNENLNINNLIYDDRESNDKHDDKSTKISDDLHEFILEEEKYPDLCKVCEEKIDIEEKIKNKLPCGHLFCSNCWFNYLKTTITEGKTDEIKCMDHLCNEKLSEEFIFNHISNENKLIIKYEKFSKKFEILKDENKRLCPNPDCESFLQRSEMTKYVECENGHKYCFECLKPPHDDKPCENQEERQFMSWKKGKRVKRCPRCQMYTEKNEGCNHMTCANCNYQWCWLCEGEYKYGHYDSGKCKGYLFTDVDSLIDIPKLCGLHNIFSCVFKPVVLPFKSKACYLDYLYILGFWLFGVIAIFIFEVMEFLTDKLDFSEEMENAIVFFVSVMGICLFCCFQIPFFCLITPFILISLIYRPFFYIFIFFFGLGN